MYLCVGAWQQSYSFVSFKELWTHFYKVFFLHVQQIDIVLHLILNNTGLHIKHTHNYRIPNGINVRRKLQNHLRNSIFFNKTTELLPYSRQCVSCSKTKLAFYRHFLPDPILTFKKGQICNSIRLLLEGRIPSKWGLNANLFLNPAVLR